LAPSPSTACVIATSAACRMLISSMMLWSTTALQRGLQTRQGQGHGSQHSVLTSQQLLRHTD
jgi:hypothetical protein